MRGMGGAMRMSTAANSRTAHKEAAGHQFHSKTQQTLARTKSFVDKRHPFHGKKKKVLAYLLYLISFLMASSYARPTIHIYNQNNVIRNIFSLDESDVDAEGLVFDNIHTEKEWWDWMKGTFAAAIMHEDIQPGRPDGTVLELLTGVQIRQIRVKQVPCGGEIRTSTLRCFPTFAEGDEDTESFGPTNQWTWSPASSVVGYDHSVSGQFGVYESSGYIVPNASSTVEDLRATLSRLEKANWIGPQTRAVVVDVNIWNPSQRLISAVKMQSEFTTVGRVLPYQVVKTFEYKKWVDTTRAYWYWEMLFVVLVVIYSLEEAIELITTINSRRKASAESAVQSGHSLATAHVKSLVRADHLLDAYFEDPWNVMDCLNYTIALVVIAIEVQARLQLHAVVDLVNEQHIQKLNSSSTEDEMIRSDRDAIISSFIAMFGPGYLSELAYTLMGVNAVITWAKLFKYLNSFPHLAMLSTTLKNAFHPVRNFSIMFFIVFLSAGQAFNMAFGAHIDNYSTPSGAMMSLFRALLGDFEYLEIQKVDPVAGPLLFVVYILLVGFILLNMFIAILAEAKVEIFGDIQAEHKDEWEGAVTMIEYLNLTIRSVLHHTLELPFYILRYGGEKGKQLYAAKKADDSQKRSNETIRLWPAKAPVDTDDEEVACKLDQDSLSKSTTIDVYTTEEGANFSTIDTLREIVQLNRQLVQRLDDLQARPRFSGSGPVGAPKLSVSELTRLVDEQQLTVGVSSPPKRQSPSEVASPNVSKHYVCNDTRQSAELLKRPHRVPPIENPPVHQQHQQQHEHEQEQDETAAPAPAPAASTAARARDRKSSASPASKPTSSDAEVVRASNRKTPSPPILKQPGGPIVHENAPTIAFSSEVTTKEITPVKPKPKYSSTRLLVEPKATGGSTVEPTSEAGSDPQPAAGWLRGTTKPRSSNKVAPPPASVAAGNDGIAQPTRNRTRTRVKREP